MSDSAGRISQTDGTQSAGTKPKNAGAVLGTLILVAAVANLNLSVANVALPDIGKSFDASQAELDLVAVGFSLGLAASVLWLGAVGDRHGRKMMLVLGMSLSIPAGVVAAWAPSVEVLIVARVVGGFAAGMAFPTTLALITALWSGPRRTRSIALWSAVGGSMAALGPLMSGALQEEFWWGSVFLLTVPLAILAIFLTVTRVPSHVNETTDPVDNIGGVLSVVMIGAFVMAINFSAVKNSATVVISAAVLTVAAGIAFILRERRAEFPLFDLDVAGRRVFWVAGLAGCIVFGTLMGAVFVGQQYLQNVLAYEPFESGAAILPAAVFMLIAAPQSARLVISKGSRFTLLAGYVFCFLGILTMLLLWSTEASYWQVALAYAFIGIGVGLAGTPASSSLTGSVPVDRAGMASGTADLQRDLGGAVMQSVMGVFLAAGYASALAGQISSAPAADQQKVSSQAEVQAESSFSATEIAAEKYPQYSEEILAAARESFVDGQHWAYLAGLTAVMLGAVLVFTMFPRHSHEIELLQEYHEEDRSRQPAGSA